MSRIAWDQIGKRWYEIGLDRGVLYLPDRSGVPWNGLTSVDEDNSAVQVTSYWFEGVKYLDTRTSNDYSATLKALTYPKEFYPFDGIEQYASRMYLADQPVPDYFGLSYRTRIGTDNDENFGYKIHLLYNLTAAPETKTYATLTGGATTPSELSWKITGVPEHAPGFRHTAHVIIDTTEINPFLVRDIENLLYGTDAVYSIPEGTDIIDGGTPSTSTTATGPATLDGGSAASAGAGTTDGGTPFTGGVTNPDLITPEKAPRLPPLAELMSMLESWTLVEITDNGDGTWTAEAPDELITVNPDGTFEIRQANATYLDADRFVITTASGF